MEWSKEDLDRLDRLEAEISELKIDVAALKLLDALEIEVPDIAFNAEADAQLRAEVLETEADARLRADIFDEEAEAELMEIVRGGA